MGYRERMNHRAETMPSVLCRWGWHHWTKEFVGTSWQPDDYVEVCSRCGWERAALRGPGRRRKP